MARFRWLFILLAVCALPVFATTAHAQFGLPGIENALFITFSPVSPSPGDTVIVSVQSPIIDISTGDVVWQANGHTIAQGKGVDSASLKAGALGSETRVDVAVVATDGVGASAQATIIPTELDLLVDSDSYTPPFYRGRPHPSAGTELHLEAVPRFKRAGLVFAASDLTYTWRRNGEVLGSISGRGKSTATIPVLHIFGTDSISVEARSADGLLSHTSSFSLSASEPTLALYEDHPLYGILFHLALAASSFIPETEMTFAAVPFFAPARSVYDPALTFAWRVNSADISTDSANPSELTINAEHSSGIALVELELTHSTNYYLDAKGAWNITFSSAESGVGIDQFHTPAE